MSATMSSILGLLLDLGHNSNSSKVEVEQSPSSSVREPRLASLEQPGMGEPRVKVRLWRTESISLAKKMDIYIMRDEMGKVGVTI